MNRLTSMFSKIFLTASLGLASTMAAASGLMPFILALPQMEWVDYRNPL